MNIRKSPLSLILGVYGTLLFLGAFPLTAQNAAAFALSAVKEGKLLVGAGFSAALPFGDYAEVVSGTFGAEASLGVRPAGSLPLEFSLRVTGEGGIPAAANLSMALGTATLFGAGWRLELPRLFSLTASAEAGSYAHWLKAGRDDPMPNAWLVYFDPLVRMSLSARYTRGNLEFELASTFTALIERSGLLPAAGFRAGIYRLFK